MDDPFRAWAPQRSAIGQVSRVEPVGRAPRGDPAEAVRVTDPREPGWRRPLPGRIPPGDVLQFETLVFGGPVLASIARPAANTETAVAAATTANASRAARALADEAAALSHPADRITHTLRQLSRVHGL